MHLDAMVYPTWSNPPRLIGDLNTPPATTTSSSRRTPDFPRSPCRWATPAAACCRPACSSSAGAWDERTLIRLAYGYEQATHRRRPPTTTPPLN